MMAINVQFYKVHNHLTNEDIVIPRIVNQQALEFNELCEYLADGSTVTAADVSAVMKQIEMRLPLILGLNAKVVCSPEGLTFRPKVSGSLTQSQLKAKLEAKKAAETDPEKAALIDVNRELTLADLSIGDLTASIAIEMPKKWDERFKSKATFKRVTKATTEVAEDNEEAPDDNTQGGGTDNTQNGGTDNTQGGDQGGGNSSITPGEGD
jgi:hypothetical protein